MLKYFGCTFLILQLMAAVCMAEPLTALVEHKGTFGEKELARRIQIAGENIGWHVDITENINHGIYKRPDFIITLSTSDIKNDKPVEVPRFLLLSSSIDSYFRKQKYWWWPWSSPALKPSLKNIQYFDGFLSSFQNLGPLKHHIESLGKKFHAVYFYPSVQEVTPAQLPRSPKLYTCGANWDKLRQSKKYQILYKLLAKTDNIDFYGPKSAWRGVSSHWEGELPFDGVTFIKTASKYQTALIMHSKRHLEGGVPTARIFEAAAAGNVIITDENKFIRDHFGDAVLYIDQTKSARNIFAQIETHLEWIKQNPEAANQLATRAHKIFTDHFTLEKELRDVQKMYEGVKQIKS